MNALSLFSGIGGIDLASEWAGIKTVAFCEYADFPRKVLEKHWPRIPIFKDVRELNKKLLENEGIINESKTIDIVHGGFPCQPYSVAGKKKGKEDDRDLWPEMFRIIKEIKPNWVVGENVAHFARTELDRTLSDLESIGYDTRAFILPALSVGAKHRRDRIFIVANSNNKRWGGLDKSFEIGRDQLFEESISLEARKRVWDIQDNILSSGKRILSEPGGRLQRNDDGLSEGMDRLKAIGNAVMPQQIYPIFKAIVEIEKVNE